VGSAVRERTRKEFDLIARLIAAEPETPDPYDLFLLARIPADCRTLLEVGCGAGRMARAAAARGARVTAIDGSPGMIELARRRAGDGAPIRYLCGDFMTCPIDEVFDCVLTVATLHHMDPAPALDRMKGLLGPGGVLVLHDLRAVSGAGDWLLSGLRAAATADLWRWTRGRLRQSRELREAWRDHGQDETYLTMEEARALCREHLPGAILYRHPLWRYTAVWSRPVDGIVKS
jgi:SAM-dependent methyltransferase